MFAYFLREVICFFGLFWLFVWWWYWWRCHLGGWVGGGGVVVVVLFCVVVGIIFATDWGFRVGGREGGGGVVRGESCLFPFTNRLGGPVKRRQPEQRQTLGYYLAVSCPPGQG